MAYTYSRLASTTVGAGGTSAITFSNIPQNYTDLVLYTSLRDSASTASTNYSIRLNGVATTTAYTRRNIYGTGTTAGSTNGTGEDVLFIGYSDSNTATVNTFGNGMTYIPNYTSSTSKSISSDTVAETNGTTVSMALTAGLFANNAAINSITINPWTGPFLQYSTATLYGVRVEL